MVKKIKKIVVLVMAFAMVLGTLAIMTACEGSIDFTNEEHIARITERVQERFIDSEDYPYTGFTVTILYNTHAEEPQFFMIEFMPDGFFYGVIHRNRYYLNTRNFRRGSHVQNGGWVFRGDWRYLDENYVGDDNAEIVYRSHFYIFGITSGRKYMHGINKFGGLAPAIRTDNGFLCLIEGRAFQEGGDAPIGVFNPASSSNRGNRI